MRRISRSVKTALAGLVLSLGLVPQSLAAEIAATDAVNRRLSLDEALAAFVGPTVILRGYIGSGYDWNDRTMLYFKSEDGSLFPVEFRAGRIAQRKLADCRLDLYEGGRPCALSGEGRLQRQGAQLRLVITRATDIGPAQPIDASADRP